MYSVIANLVTKCNSVPNEIRRIFHKDFDDNEKIFTINDGQSLKRIFQDSTVARDYNYCSNVYSGRIISSFL